MEMQVKPVDAATRSKSDLLAAERPDPAKHLGLVRCEVSRSFRFRDVAAKWAAAGQPIAIEDSEEYAVSCVALMNASYGFDPERGVKFSTFATWAIRNALNRMYGYEHAEMRDVSRESLDCDCTPDRDGLTVIDYAPSREEPADAPLVRAEQREEYRKLLQRMMRRLTPRSRQMVILHYLHGISRTEIAKQVVPPTTTKCVDATIGKALQVMREYAQRLGIEW